MSIKVRFLFTLVANLAKAVLGFLTGLLIARGLGPEQYGVFAFLLASFSALLQLLDMGSSSAFFTFTSKRNRSKRFILSYIAWLGVQLLVSVAIIYLLAPDTWVQSIWHGETKERVVIAFCAVFLQRQVWNFVTQLGESQRFTVRVQGMSIAIFSAHLLLVGGFFLLKDLSIELVYGLMILEFVVAIVLAMLLLPIATTDEKETFPQLLNEYKTYCLPLIPFAWLGVLMGFADTWLLQEYGGAVQQAFYSVGAQFAVVSLLATMSILKILWKEVAEDWENLEIQKIERLYNKTAHSLFFIGALISGFFIPWSEQIIEITLGDEYMAATLAMAIMFLYPIHQSLGQVVASMFLAMEKTKAHTVFGTIHILLSLIVVYFVLAGPQEPIPGLGMGAVGMSVKMVIVQFITVNLQMWWLSRHMGWTFKMAYQFIEIAMFVGLGYACHFVALAVIPADWHLLITICFGGGLYVFVAAIFILALPHKVGFESVPQVQKLRRVMRFN